MLCFFLLIHHNLLCVLSLLFRFSLLSVVNTWSSRNYAFPFSEFYSIPLSILRYTSARRSG